MQHEGCIAIPLTDGGWEVYKFQAETYKHKNPNGLGGGKIKFMKLTCSGETVAVYFKGWAVKPTTSNGWIAVRIMELDYSD